MIACGGGKNGSGNHANFAVATSHKVRNSPSTSNHGAREAVPKWPSKLPPKVAAKMMPAMMNALTASPWVRDQSPKSSHSRHERPKPTHARLANRPAPLARNNVGSESAAPANAAPSSADCGIATVLDGEYVDTNTLREFCRVSPGLEHGHELQIIGIGLEFLLEHSAYGMMTVGVVPDHRPQIFQTGGLGRIGLE